MTNMIPSVLRRGLLQRLRLLLISMLFAAIPTIAAADDNSDFFLCVSRNDAYSLRGLLERGVDPNLKESARGDSGLILALRENAMKTFGLLINSPKIDLEAQSNNGDTALMIASFSGNRAAVAALLDKDAEVNKHGWTALHYAAANGDGDIIRLLLEKSAYIDAESPNKTTPVMMAARAGHLDVVKQLMEAGADISLKNDQGLTAADFAIKNEHPEIAEILKPGK
jgi:ankyrin repeat protein